VARFIGERQHDYRAILANYVRVAELCRGLAVPVLLDLHDALSLHYARAAAHAGGLKGAAYRAEGNRLRKYELACVRQFPLSLVVSEIDRDYLVRHGASPDKLLAVPVAVPQEILLRPSFGGPEDQDCVLVGRMAYAPNRDAARFFAREILPEVRKRVPRARFTIVGADAPPDVIALGAEPGIAVTGTVADPCDFVERAKVVVAPVRYGAGIQNKVLQGLALRKAVVMSSLCAEAIGGKQDEHFLVADAPEDFAASVARCLQDHGLRERLGAAGRALVEAKYSWDAVGSRIAAEVERLATTPRPA
jgi:hypothetical protein